MTKKKPLLWIESHREYQDLIMRQRIEMHELLRRQTSEATELALELKRLYHINARLPEEATWRNG